LRAGVELIAVRKRIPHGQWEAWCADNIHRSMRDIQKMMALAGAADPEAAAEEERAKNREARAQSKAASMPLLGDPVERLFQEFLQLDEAERREFLPLVEKETGR
jgi:hypothetical protein